MKRIAVVGLALISVSACGPGMEGETPGFDTSTSAVSASNGRSLNGRSLNGRSLNGRSLNGRSLNGTLLNGRSLNGRSLNGRSLNGRSLNGVALVAGDLIGSMWTGELDDGTQVDLRIDNYLVGTGANSDVTYYYVSYSNDTGWAPICGLDAAGAPLAAVAIDGYFDGTATFTQDPNRFTFGCRGAAVMKCVELGYKPWAFAPSGVSLRDHFATCTRMIRADYCGDGRSWTVDGWQINVYDNLGIQVDTESTASWLFEAEWSPNGASCVDEYRVLELVAQGTIPACAAEKINGTCGIAPSSGVLIKSEYNSAGIVGLVAALVTGSPTGAISSDLETALHDLENGFLALAQVPPDAHAALGDFKDANQYLQLAVDRHAVDANYGRGLMNRVTGLSRVQLVRALNANACQPKDALKLLQATVTMTAGDVSRLFGQYRDAVSTYRNAFSMAKGATGKKCLVDPFQNTLEDQARW